MSDWLDATETTSDADLDYAMEVIRSDEVSQKSDRSGLISLAAVSLALAAVFAAGDQSMRTYFDWLVIACIGTTGLCMAGMLFGAWDGRGRGRVMLRLLGRRRMNARRRDVEAQEAKARADADEQHRLTHTPARILRFVRVRGRNSRMLSYVAPDC